MDARLLVAALVFVIGAGFAPEARAQLQNYPQELGATAGNSPTIVAHGADTNISLTLVPKGTGNVIISNGNVGIGSASPRAVLDISQSTNAILVPMGSTEPTGIAGMMRYNTATSTFEGYDGTGWYDFGGALGTFDKGTAAAPGWAVTQDTASGLFQAIGSTLSISAGGKEAGRFLQGSGTVVNYPTFTGASTGNGVTIASAGTDTNINLNLSPKGTGNVIISNGNIGIGSTSPRVSLDLSQKTDGVILPTTSASAGAVCSNAGAVRYNSNLSYVEYCNGSNWSAFVATQTSQPATASSGSGYFVITKTTWNGNLGGRSGADSKCLTELSSTNTGWAGYSTANSNGQLVGSKVHAFICDDSTCNNLIPLTTYYFADAHCCPAH